MQRDNEAGTGIFGASFGVFMVLLVLLFTVQFVYDLYATSVITGHAYDAARDVAGYEHSADRASAAARAEARMLAAIGDYDGAMRLVWMIDSDSISLSITATHPSILPPIFGPLALDNVNETITVRTEEPR